MPEDCYRAGLNSRDLTVVEDGQDVRGLWRHSTRMGVPIIAILLRATQPGRCEGPLDVAQRSKWRHNRVRMEPRKSY